MAQAVPPGRAGRGVQNSRQRRLAKSNDFPQQKGLAQRGELLPADVSRRICRRRSLRGSGRPVQVGDLLFYSGGRLGRVADGQ